MPRGVISPLHSRYMIAAMFQSTISYYFHFSPDILKHEMKVFFVKYNDPIYVKLEKLDIMIRLTNQANIAQVLAELKE